jgi:hypothetical protein
MNDELIKNSYIKLPKFISNERADELKAEFTQFAKVNNLRGDGQAPNSSVSYNYKSFLELLCNKTAELSKIVESQLLPTYTYARVYYEKSVLERHVDRPACEVSITLNLGGDEEWPIYIETPEGKEVEMNLEPGDAMLYLGCVAPHWRNEFSGKEYCQAFMHYVQSDGPFAWAYFDKQR